ncbi:hypothetical protein AAE478_001696 [Parahypoxylon ruwenzoriense]
MLLSTRSLLSATAALLAACRLSNLVVSAEADGSDLPTVYQGLQRHRSVLHRLLPHDSDIVRVECSLPDLRPLPHPN